MSGRSRRKTSSRIDYARLNSVGFGSVDIDEVLNQGKPEQTQSETGMMAEVHDSDRGAADVDLLADDADLDGLLQQELAAEHDLDVQEAKQKKIDQIMKLRKKNAARQQKMDRANVAKSGSDDEGQGHQSRRRRRNALDDVDSLMGLGRKQRKHGHSSTETSSGTTSSSTGRGSSSSTTRSSSSSSSVASGFSLSSHNGRGKLKKSKSKRSKKSKNKKQRSGIHDKSSKWVKKPQTYPHALLDNQYVMHETKYKELTFGQFVAGELEIILNGKMKPKDAKHRLEMLRKTAYRSLSFDWDRLLQIHAAVIRQIEIGKARWGSNFDQVERLILESTGNHKSSRSGAGVGTMSAVGGARPKASKGEGSSNAESRSWWCREYQANKCDKAAPHPKRVGGKTVMVKHFCASCFQVRKVEVGHPERSAACPYFEASNERRDN